MECFCSKSSLASFFHVFPICSFSFPVTMGFLFVTLCMFVVLEIQICNFEVWNLPFVHILVIRYFVVIAPIHTKFTFSPNDFLTYAIMNCDYWYFSYILFYWKIENIWIRGKKVSRVLTSGASTRVLERTLSLLLLCVLWIWIPTETKKKVWFVTSECVEDDLSYLFLYLLS